MSKQGRILIVEDREEWRHTLAEALQGAGFDAEEVESADKARHLLDTKLYHVVILDIRLVEGDIGNTDGLKLLRELDQRNLTEAIQVIMLSSYGTKDQMRTAFRDYKVADFVFKQRFDGHAFLEDVRRVFTKNTCINLEMDIRWSQASSAEAVGNLKLRLPGASDYTRVLPGSLLQRRVAAELDDLLRRLFYEAEKLLIKPMSSGHSGTGVIGVRPFYANRGGGSPVVVKFGSAHQILQEHNNFREYVQPLVGGSHCTSIQGQRRTPLLGGIIYTFLGASSQLEDFGAFYSRSDSEQITKALDRLFRATCKDWYANASRLQLLDLTEDYQRVLSFTSEKLERAFYQLQAAQRVTISDQGCLYFQALEQERPFRNPLWIMDGRSLAFPTYTGPTHGNFNQHNLLVDSDGHIWMIDFQGTGQGHLLRDIVSLDSVVRYQLLTAWDATLQERLEMEQALCSIEHFSQVDQLSGRFRTKNPALAKAYAVVIYLRKLARDMVGQNHADDFNEYYAALLFNALNTIRLRTLEKEQREHALLAACLLVEKLGLEDQSGETLDDKPIRLHSVQRFLGEIGFEIKTILSQADFIVMADVNAPLWRERFPRGVYIRVLFDDPLDQSTVQSIFDNAKLHTDCALVVINQPLTGGGWLAINGLRAEEQNRFVFLPIEELLIKESIALKQERQTFSFYINKHLGKDFNPYDVRGPVSDAVSFFGRASLIDELLNMLKLGQNLGLFGLHKMGKSSVLLKLQKIAKFPVAYIYLRHIYLRQDDGLERIFSAIIAAWATDARIKYPDFECPIPSFQDKQDARIVFEAYTKKLLSVLEHYTDAPSLAIFLDEIGNIIPYKDEDETTLQLYVNLMDTIRGLQHETNGISLLIAGVHPTVARRNYLWENQKNPMHQVISERFLSPLDRDDCIHMIRSLGQQIDLTYTDECMEYIVQMSGAHPFLARQICNLAYQDRGNMDSFSLEYLRKVVRNFVSNPATASYFDDYGLWAEIGKQYMGEVDICNASYKILESLAASSIGLTETEVCADLDKRIAKQALHGLKERCIVSFAEKENRYYITFGLFSAWIRLYKLDME